MPAPVIEIRGLGKRYRICHSRPPDTLKSYFKSLLPFGSQASRQAAASDFWALQGLDLSVELGQCLAIAGHNGSGKSTLLKIISRIIPPTTGSVITRGRIAALLEVGTGFHPELTGRENIFLNGAMLGCSGPEIRRRFDAIVDFSGIERFLDTPVKHYSSGMYVRLGYAIAAHIYTEILILDEVLSVGDADFQKKCIEHLRKLIAQGSTVLFVTHSEALQKRLATHIATISNGSLVQVASNIPSQ